MLLAMPLRGLTLGLSAYYKIAQNSLDEGQFGDLVVGAEAERQAAQRLDRDTGVEIVGPLGLHRIVGRHFGRGNGAGQRRDRAGAYLQEWRRREVARITDTRREHGVGLPHYVDARAQLVLLGGAVDGVETQAEIHRDGGHDPPFVLQVDTVRPSAEIGAVGEAYSLVRRKKVATRVVGIGDKRQGIAGREAGSALALHQEPATQRMGVRNLPGAVALRASGKARALGPRRDTVVQQVAERIGLIGEARIAGEARELEVDVLVALLQRGNGEVGLLPLALVEDRTVPVVDAVDGEVRRLERDVGNLEARARPATNEGEPRIVVDDAGDLGQPVPLIGVVMQGRDGRGRVLDAEAIVDELAGGEIVDLPRPAAVGEGGLRIVVRATSDGELGAGTSRAGLQRDVDDARYLQPVLGGQR